MCERKMNCLGYDRKDSIYCAKCREGWKGERCDEIDCGEGGKQITFDECLCNEPYSGKFCKELLTEHINLSYNKAIVNAMGPIGSYRKKRLLKE
uniref:EGF-like domain-containing protein n=1 Tax=Acrobeloides nanus TaxID=290746 RepID=A0A914DIL6_9BILA